MRWVQARPAAAASISHLARRPPPDPAGVHRGRLTQSRPQPSPYLNKERFVDMAQPGSETYFENGEWKDRVQGSSRAANKHNTKAAAEKAGRQMARNRKVEHTIKNKDGTVGEKNS